MTNRIKCILIWFARKLPLKNQPTVYLEGGLGSQILGIMQYEIMKEALPATKLDVSYFYPQQTSKTEANWVWALEGYGINLPLQKENFLAKLRYLQRPQNYAATNLNLEIWREISRRQFNEIFPIHEDTKKIMQDLNIALREDFVAIHIRRGDYLKVSSKIIEVEELGKLFQTLEYLSNGRLLVFSDDTFSKNDEAKIRSYWPKDVTFVSGGDQHAVHGLLRFASVLVTSNSTFSLTAALLSEHPKQVVFAPTHFFSVSERDVNFLIQQLSTWMLIERPTNGA
jgi:hypothetical protein